MEAILVPWHPWRALPRPPLSFLTGLYRWKGRNEERRSRKFCLAPSGPICHHPYHLSVRGPAFSCQHQLSPSWQGPPCATQQLAVPPLSQHLQGLTGTAQTCSSSPVPQPTCSTPFPGLWSRAPVPHSDNLPFNTPGISCFLPAPLPHPLLMLPAMPHLRSAPGIISTRGDLVPRDVRQGPRTFWIATVKKGEMLLVSRGRGQTQCCTPTTHSAVPDNRRYLAYMSLVLRLKRPD